MIAQAPGAPVSGGPGTIVGVVRDTAGKPIESAQVSLGVAGPRTLTAADGSFRFERLLDTSYTVSARRIGYYPQSRWLTITDSGSVVQFSLVPVARVLPAVVAAVRRGGLSGVVEDSAHNAVPKPLRSSSFVAGS